jgi:hypothetical protein
MVLLLTRATRFMENYMNDEIVDIVNNQDEVVGTV